MEKIEVVMVMGLFVAGGAGLFAAVGVMTSPSVTGAVEDILIHMRRRLRKWIKKTEKSWEEE